MKKVLLIILLLIPVNIFALSKEKVIFYKCVDGDTARFIINKEEVKVRFIGINAPEIAKQDKPAEEYGDKAANYTCKKLKNADKIEIEYEKNSEKYDKYDRLLAYVFVDGKLLQESIVKNGYAEVKYIKNNYKYYNELTLAETKAITSKKGMYSDKKEELTEKEFAKLIKKYCKKLISNILKEIF